VCGCSEGSDAMVSSDASIPKWPLRLAELAGEIQSPPSLATLDAARAEAWELLNFSISKYLRIHSTRLGAVSREDFEDIAAEKSLDLLRKVESGAWDLSHRPAADIRGFLSKVARNGLVDALREAGRRVEPADEDRPEWEIGVTGEEITMSATEAPDIRVEQKEFAGALRRCAENLNPRSRLVWFFRVFLSLSSKEIAAHPEVRLKVTHVDVLLQRAREGIRECMKTRGFDPQDMPPGVFVELWAAFRSSTL